MTYHVLGLNIPEHDLHLSIQIEYDAGKSLNDIEVSIIDSTTHNLIPVDIQIFNNDIRAQIHRAVDALGSA